ncbi:MAG: hypothetical protein ACM3JP_01115 [Betaproteobacteria bacterium]
MIDQPTAADALTKLEPLVGEWALEASRRKGRNDWAEGDTAREAMRRATLLTPRKPPPWLAKAAADAQRMIDHQSLADEHSGGGSSGESSGEESADD